jgi:hypothetical protein
MLTPIETFYRGYHFRSRLEARWAVLLSRLKIRWQYEPQGFDLGSTWYLPDFWIRLRDDLQRPYVQGSPPEHGFWLEIKPTEPDTAALQKCAALSTATGHCVYLAADNIGPGEFSVWKWSPRTSELIGHHARRTRADWCLLDCYLLLEASSFGPDPADLAEAYAYARAARFEHGEQP